MSLLFVKALTADDKYSRHNRQNIPQQIEMAISQKPKTSGNELFNCVLFLTDNITMLPFSIPDKITHCFFSNFITWRPSSSKLSR